SMISSGFPAPTATAARVFMRHSSQGNLKSLSLWQAGEPARRGEYRLPLSCARHHLTGFEGGGQRLLRRFSTPFLQTASSAEGQGPAT
ncbi:hypothetical protein, partial [Mesorhizobium sp. WSM3860]|uniref:hypothetical protein n=1 Tax=Mesorhizobium sp. WSM3860 TaxID=2029403 RepID=UPI001AECB658